MSPRRSLNHSGGACCWAPLVALLLSLIPSNASAALTPLTTLDGGTATQYAYCAQIVTGAGTTVAAMGSMPGKLDAFEKCLARVGTTFDPLADFWVAAAQQHCASSVAFGMGANYNAYLQCLRDRKITPTAVTVGGEYIKDVYRHCWGSLDGVEYALEALQLAASLASGAVAVRGAVTTAAKIGEAMSWLAQEGAQTVITGMPFEKTCGAKCGFFPGSISNFPGYKQCLLERSQGAEGLSIAPMHLLNHDNLTSWADTVKSYCVRSLGDPMFGRNWKYEDYYKCLADRDYPKDEVDGPGWFDTITGRSDTVNLRIHSVCSDAYPVNTSGYFTCRQEMHWQTATTWPYGRVALVASNGQFVRASHGGGSDLHADRTQLGIHEQFRLIGLSDTTAALQAWNGQFVRAVNGGGDGLLADASRVSWHEEYRVEWLADKRLALKTYSGNYVTLTDSGLRASATSIDHAATFVYHEEVTFQNYPSRPGWNATEYRVRAVHSNKCLDVNGGSAANGAKVIQWGCHGGANQRFSFLLQSDGSYRIVAGHSGRSMDVSNYSTQAGATVWQWDWNGTNNQRWRLSMQWDTSFAIQSVNSGLVLDVWGASNGDGAQVAQFDHHGGTNQHFFIE